MLKTQNGSRKERSRYLMKPFPSVKWWACFWLAVLFLNCDPRDESITRDPQARLAFSSDTVFFDTIFTDTISITRRLRVFNPEDRAVEISSIALQGGTNSSFKLVVEGLEGQSFEDVFILGEDSLLILISVNIPSRGEDVPFLVEDLLEFTLNTNQQQVPLVAWGQEANFFRSQTILPCNTIWNADKPYVLYHSVLVDTLCTLTIKQGTRIFLNNEAAFFVRGTLKVEGLAEEPVLFSNVRLDRENVPGQWRGIIFLEGSKDNTIDHAVIRNAEFGIRLGTPDNDTLPDLVLNNSVIENMSTFGILCFTSDLEATNTLIDNCIQFCVGHFAGGYYRYRHCTIANYSVGLFSQEPSAIFTDNLILGDGSTLTEDLYVRLENSIIWGNHQDGEELILNGEGGSQTDVLLDHLMVRTSNSQFEINQNILGTDPGFPRFVDPSNFDYHLDTLSPAQDQGRQLSISVDLLGRPRDEFPDLGAYERQQ